MPSYSLLSFLLNFTAASVVNLQNKDGSFPPGHNGPYMDPETPVRNTSHFLFLLAKLFQKSNNELFKDAGEKAIEYLFSSAARPGKGTFHCRNKEGKDLCNGLMGQAWVIEALVKAYDAFNRKDCYELAEEVFHLHPWNKNTALWKRVEIDGNILPYDKTFNHQLWFAAAGSLLKESPIAMNQALIFIQKIARHVTLYPNGVIFHSSSMGSLLNYFKNGPKEFLKELRFRNHKRKKKNELYSKSVGYHGFNLYAFAILKNAFPDEKFWETETFKKLINACNSKQFQKDLKHSEFGYVYNLSGIEIAYAIETFFQNKDKATSWIEKQFVETFDYDSNSFSRGAPDKRTASARIYEAARLKHNYAVEVN